jgi:hypothetical protein
MTWSAKSKDEPLIFKFTVGDQTYTINPDPMKLTAAELVAVERHTGLGLMEFAEALANPKGSASAITALVWLARRRSGDYVKWDTFAESFHPYGLELEVVDDEPAAAEPS